MIMFLWVSKKLPSCWRTNRCSLGSIYRIDAVMLLVHEMNACTGHACSQSGHPTQKILKTISNRKEVVCRNFALKWERTWECSSGSKVCKSAVDCLARFGVASGVCLRA